MKTRATLPYGAKKVGGFNELYPETPDSRPEYRVTSVLVSWLQMLACLSPECLRPECLRPECSLLVCWSQAQACSMPVLAYWMPEQVYLSPGHSSQPAEMEWLEPSRNPKVVGSLGKEAPKPSMPHRNTMSLLT